MHVFAAAFFVCDGGDSLASSKLRIYSFVTVIDAFFTVSLLLRHTISCPSSSACVDDVLLFPVWLSRRPWFHLVPILCIGSLEVKCGSI